MYNGKFMSLNKSFYFIRHAETDYNRKNIYMGSLDVPLNQFGRQQASIAAKILKDEPLDFIVSSPLARAKSTAEIIAAEIGKEIIFINELQECVIGMEGCSINKGEAIQDWLTGKLINPPETIEEFEKRIISGFQKALSLNGMVLVVSHGGVYAALRRVLNLPAIHIKNCMIMYHRLVDEGKNLYYSQIIE
jgi:broad specificity phosphatase PhoE